MYILFGSPCWYRVSIDAETWFEGSGFPTAQWHASQPSLQGNMLAASTTALAPIENVASQIWHYGRELLLRVCRRL